MNAMLLQSTTMSFASHGRCHGGNRRCSQPYNKKSRFCSRVYRAWRLQTSGAVLWHTSSKTSQASDKDAAAPAWAKSNRRVSRPQYRLPGHGIAGDKSHHQKVGRSDQPTGTAAVAERPPQQNLVKHRQPKQQQATQPMQAPVTGRKNPELYALAAQQQDLAIPQLPSITGAVGSTGTFGSTAADVADGGPGSRQPAPILPEQQQKQQQKPRLANRSVTKPEVLAPAGGWPQLRAAVENGADAVYFGVTGFNARARAANFEPEDLPGVMTYLHERGVKGYVALNILVFDAELSCLEDLVRQLAAAGVDAVIVQDVGAVSLIRHVAPNLAIHGSTQMSITSAEGAEFAAGLGVTRVVVGRELSVREIAQLSGHTSVEVEAFCHGALCVSYSGQCYSSEAWGGRSANRGQCAQACRMPYGLVVDGKLKDLHDLSYLLSPQDLMALDHIPDMIAAGVGCFKIEGRLKGPEYVAATTAAYRAGVDAAWEQLLQEEQQQQDRIASNSTASISSSGSNSGSSISPDLLQDLAQVFSRGQDEWFNGLTPGFLEGSQHQRLVRGRAPRHRGLCLGRVTGVTDRGVVIQGLVTPVKRGDGVVFDQGRPELAEEGGSVWDMYQVTDSRPQQQQQQQQQQQHRHEGGGGRATRGRSAGRGSNSSRSGSGHKIIGEAAAGSAVELVFGPGQVDLFRVAPGDLVWKSRDPALESRLRSSYEAVSSTTARKLPVQVTVSGSVGCPLTLTLTDTDGNTAAADSGEVVLQPAAKRHMTHEDVVAAVGQLGDNVLAPASIDVSCLTLDQGLFLPASTFKSVRRAAAEQLLALRQQHHCDEGMAQQPVLPVLLTAATKPTTTTSSSSSSIDPVTSQPSAADGVQQQQHHRLHHSWQGPVLRVLCRTPGQVHAALRVSWLDEVIVDFLEVHGLKEAVAAVQAAGKKVVVAMPRVLKPGETRLLWFYLKLGADALLLRGAGCLQQLLELGGPGTTVPSIAAISTSAGTSSSASQTADGASSKSTVTPTSVAVAAAPGISASVASGGVVIPRLEGDFSLNAANVLAADLLLGSGLSKLCLTHDLNAAQLADLAQGLGPRAQQLEVVCHQHLPIFHTEHCVFCRFLSSGNSYIDCGHPCEQHTVQLRDSAGDDHLVLADMGCRNTVFNASAHSGLYYLPRLTAAGCGTFRVELVDEPPEVVGELLQGYRAVLDGHQRPGDVWEWLRGVSKGGVSAGSLEVKRERAAASLRPTARRS